MEKFIVKGVYENNVHGYMMGGIGYSSRIEIISDSLESATIIAKEKFKYGMLIDIISEKDYISKCEECRKEIKEFQEKEALRKAEKKAKANAKLQAQAEELNMSLEDYKKKKNIERKISQVNKELSKLYEEIQHKEDYIKKLQQDLKEFIK